MWHADDVSGETSVVSPEYQYGSVTVHGDEIEGLPRKAARE